MRDGVRVACDIYRPDAEGEFPAVFGMSPYGKDVQTLPIPHKPRMCEYHTIEAGDTEFLVSRGYVHVIAEARGTGYSEGKYDICQIKEQEDGYDLVEWMAQQPWCNGNVGMLGISYFAFIQYLVAAQQPPHLKAIFPHDGWGDMYRDISHHGGIFCHGWLPSWNTMFPNLRSEPASLSMYGEEELNRRAQKWLYHGSIRKHPEIYNTLLFPQYKPLLFDWLINEFDGPYYWERSAYTKWGKIKAAAYLGTEPHQYTVSMHQRGVLSAWAGINAPKKLVIRSSAPEVPFHEWHDDVLRWFDYWLKGIDNGIMDEPPIKIWVRSADEWIYADEWPLPETKWTSYYLTANKLLEEDPLSTEEVFDSFDYDPKPIYPQSRVTFALFPMPEYLSYTTQALDQDTLMVGHIALYLYASISGDDADFIVKLKDVSPDGSEAVLSRGWLKASHREVDKDRSKPWQPYHSHTSAIPVVAGQINEYAIEIRPISNLFRKGHKIKLEIWGCDYPSDAGDPTIWWPTYNHIPYDKEVSYKIYHTPEYPSYLLLPIIPRSN
jgi:predicted acyl esterase